MNILKTLVILYLFFICYPCLTYQNKQGYPYYQPNYDERMIRPMPITIPQRNYTNNYNYNSNAYSQNNNLNYSYQSNNTYDSGSTHFIYSLSPNPTYCVSGSSYSICH